MDRIVARVLECLKPSEIIRIILLMVEFVPYEQKICEIPEEFSEIENELLPDEVGNIIRIFNPCVSCITHMIISKTEKVFQVI